MESTCMRQPWNLGERMLGVIQWEQVKGAVKNV